MKAKYNLKKPLLKINLCKMYLGEIYIERKAKKASIWNLWCGTSNIVHKFSECIIEAETYHEAHEKMKVYADKRIAEAKELPNAGFMKNLTHKSFVTEQI